MLIVILLFLAIIAIMLVIFKHDENSWLLFGMCCSMITMFSGIIIYTAKMGGLTNSQEIFLFMSAGLKVWLQYLYITLDQLGYIIAIGRYLFPTFLLFIAMNYSMIPLIRRHRVAQKTMAAPMAVFLVLYYPRIFYILARHRFYFQKILMDSALVWIILYLVLAIFLLFYEYISITMVYYSRQFRYILIAYISLSLLYVLYCFQDPIQVYQLYSVDYMWTTGLSYSNPQLSVLEWCLLSVGTVSCVAIGFWNLLGYTQLNYEAGQVDISLERKFDTASQGISVFVHSIKNQLLSERVISKKVNQLLSAEHPDIRQLKNYADMLNQMNESMLARMEELYRSIRTKSISLRLVTIGEVAEISISRFHQKYPDVPIHGQLNESLTILADVDHLSEVIYNLLVNAQDSILVAGRGKDGRVELNTHEERFYTVLEIKDNGTGITKSMQRKIFEPFYTSKNTNSNWGMGLYYAKEIAKSHFGVLRLESIPNEGTSFFLQLPRYHSPNH